jgi:peptidoglycan/LPS O-acetylase OafA/YrhL
MAENQSSYRLFGGLRFLLAVMVVASHSALLGGPEIAAILKPWGLGNVAVMVFFCLSGYIIAEALDAFYVNRIGGFLANRALRIIPPYMAALAVSIGVHLWLASLGQLNFFDYEAMPEGIFSEKNYLSNLLLIVILYGLGHVGLQPDYPFVRYVWAVRVELHFYVVYALLFWLSNVRAGGRNWPSRVMPAAFAVFFVLSLVAILTGARQLNYFSFAPYFMLGVSMYMALERSSARARYAVAGSLALSIFHFTGYIGKGEGSFVAGPTVVLVMLCAAVLPLVRMTASWRVRLIDRWLGDLSYPIYLNHYVVTIAALSLAPLRNPAIYLACIVMCVALSWAIAQLTEPFSMHLRNRIRGVTLR